MHQSFLAYKKSRYLWIALLLSAIAILLYGLHDPQQPPNGGTWLGYGLGTLGALLIVWLTWFGVRKRQYKSSMGTVKGWLSAHVYLGLSLLVIGTLHSGFQFGMNVHTLAYVLMCLVIASGIFGVVAYVRYPDLMANNRDNLTQQIMLEEIQDIDQQLLKLSEHSKSNIHPIIKDAIEHTHFGGSTWAQLKQIDHSSVLLPKDFDHPAKTKRYPNPNQKKLIEALVDIQSRSQDSVESQCLRDIVNLLGSKKLLLGKLKKDIQMQALLEIWLYFHVPLTFGLLAALITHIITVFLYW